MPTVTTTTEAAEAAFVDTIDSLKDQLIWSQKLNLDRLRRDFDRQKQMIAIQQQQIEVLEANMFEALLRANSNVYRQQVEEGMDTTSNTLEQQQQQDEEQRAVDEHDPMDDATAAEDIHGEDKDMDGSATAEEMHGEDEDNDHEHYMLLA